MNAVTIRQAAVCQCIRNGCKRDAILDVHAKTLPRLNLLRPKGKSSCRLRSSGSRGWTRNSSTANELRPWTTSSSERHNSRSDPTRFWNEAAGSSAATIEPPTPPSRSIPHRGAGSVWRRCEQTAPHANQPRDAPACREGLNCLYQDHRTAEPAGADRAIASATDFAPCGWRPARSPSTPPRGHVVRSA